jgi:hypothetical protein
MCGRLSGVTRRARGALPQGGARERGGVEYFRGFTRERPERADAWRYLATLLEADGREDEARRVAERAAELR